MLAWIRGWRPKFSASTRARVPDETWRPSRQRAQRAARAPVPPLPPLCNVPGWMSDLDVSVDVSGCAPSSNANANANALLRSIRRIAPLDIQRRALPKRRHAAEQCPERPIPCRIEPFHAKVTPRFAVLSRASFTGLELVPSSLGGLPAPWLNMAHHWPWRLG